MPIRTKAPELVREDRQALADARLMESLFETAKKKGTADTSPKLADNPYARERLQPLLDGLAKLDPPILTEANVKTALKADQQRSATTARPITDQQLSFFLRSVDKFFSGHLRFFNAGTTAYTPFSFVMARIAKLPPKEAYAGLKGATSDKPEDASKTENDRGTKPVRKVGLSDSARQSLARRNPKVASDLG